nr:tetratricopeptide repeat protein [uncultured Campylobacter sp.]
MKKIILGLALLGSLAFGAAPKEQVKDFEQKCKAGDFKACGAVGTFYSIPTELGGKASDRDYKKALYFYEKACNGKSYGACVIMGTMYVEGKGVKKDYKKAIELFDKACDGGHADGCSNLGVMYEYGKGVKMDMTQAMGYARRACDAGSWAACGNFAANLKNNGDRASAVQYYQKACEIGKKVSWLSAGEKDLLQKYCDKYDILK